jgi:hypothetical protein
MLSYVLTTLLNIFTKYFLISSAYEVGNIACTSPFYFPLEIGTQKVETLVIATTY